MIQIICALKTKHKILVPLISLGGVTFQFPIFREYFFAIFLYNKSDVRDPRRGYFIMEHLIFIDIIFICNHVIPSTSTKF